ncbi:MAG: hypothetical protein GY782_06595 [Gammaproteobacteria bacterium]|nr:hypothetical protein [Gammaproteobacteria bacterium]
MSTFKSKTSEIEQHIENINKVINNGLRISSWQLHELYSENQKLRKKYAQSSSENDLGNLDYARAKINDDIYQTDIKPRIHTDTVINKIPQNLPKWFKIRKQGSTVGFSRSEVKKDRVRKETAQKLFHHLGIDIDFDKLNKETSRQIREEICDALYNAKTRRSQNFSDQLYNILETKRENKFLPLQYSEAPKVYRELDQYSNTHQKLTDKEVQSLKDNKFTHEERMSRYFNSMYENNEFQDIPLPGDDVRSEASTLTINEDDTLSELSDDEYFDDMYLKQDELMKKRREQAQQTHNSNQISNAPRTVPPIGNIGDSDQDVDDIYIEINDNTSEIIDDEEGVVKWNNDYGPSSDNQKTPSTLFSQHSGNTMFDPDNGDHGPTHQLFQQNNSVQSKIQQVTDKINNAQQLYTNGQIALSIDTMIGSISDVNNIVAVDKNQLNGEDICKLEELSNKMLMRLQQDYKTTDTKVYSKLTSDLTTTLGTLSKVKKKRNDRLLQDEGAKTEPVDDISPRFKAK